MGRLWVIAPNYSNFSWGWGKSGTAFRAHTGPFIIILSLWLGQKWDNFRSIKLHDYYIYLPEVGAKVGHFSEHKGPYDLYIFLGLGQKWDTLSEPQDSQLFIYLNLEVGAKVGHPLGAPVIY